MKKLLLLFIFAGIFMFSILNLISAHEHNFDETKQIIDSGISCEKLTDEQLEAIGEYYMEQMHPGEAHEYMDKMMGGEGSDSLKQIHIQMAKRLYCNEDVGGMMGGGMMSMMMGRNMMSGSIVYDDYRWNIYNILYFILLVGLIILVILIIIKLIRDLQKKR